MQRRHSEVSIPPFLLPFVRWFNDVSSTYPQPTHDTRRNALDKIIVAHQRCIVVLSYCTLIDVPVSDTPP